MLSEGKEHAVGVVVVSEISVIANLVENDDRKERHMYETLDSCVFILLVPVCV
jgi:hypothetical protein